MMSLILSGGKQLQRLFPGEVYLDVFFVMGVVAHWL
jgi:hypothetical protein